MSAIDAEPLERSNQLLLGTSIIRRELDLMGSIVVDGIKIDSDDILKYVDLETKDNIIRMLLCDPDEAFSEAKDNMGEAVVKYCSEHLAITRQAAEQYSGPDAPHHRRWWNRIDTKDPVKLGVSPSASVENRDCRKGGDV